MTAVKEFFGLHRNPPTIRAGTISIRRQPPPPKTREYRPSRTHYNNTPQQRGGGGGDARTTRYGRRSSSNRSPAPAAGRHLSLERPLADSCLHRPYSNNINSFDFPLQIGALYKQIFRYFGQLLVVSRHPPLWGPVKTPSLAGSRLK